MPKIKYSRYRPDPAEDMDLEDLMNQLRDFFLESGFYSQFDPSGRNSAQSLENLMAALAEILKDHPLIPEDWREEFRNFSDEYPDRELSEELRQFLGRLLERLVEEGYLKAEQAPRARGGGQASEGERQGNVEFELTDKSVDFLGYKMLRELIGSLGRSSFGRHDTDQLSTGVASDSPSKPYEFGDTINLDINATLLNAVRREGLGVPLNLEYSDLQVYQTEYQSSCATVLMLDCSHSMILYGEDRFTPAKQVTLALAHLIRTQFPGDTLDLVLFHDSAEQVPLAKLPAVKVGPFHTNTCEGLRLSQQILAHQRKDMRQIIMITDGKPSAITLPNGRIYKNPFGLDPMILQETFKEVANCRRSGIMINTFMVARDYYLVEFVKRVAEICRGKAYFTTTVNLANYLLMDFMTKKTRTVH